VDGRHVVIGALRPAAAVGELQELLVVLAELDFV